MTVAGLSGSGLHAHKEVYCVCFIKWAEQEGRVACNSSNCHLKNVKQAVVFHDVCVEDSHCLADAVSPIFNNIHSHIVFCDIGPCPVCWA